MPPALAQLKEILAHGEAQLVSKDELVRLFRELVNGIQAWQKKWQEKQKKDFNEIISTLQETEQELVKEIQTSANEMRQEATNAHQKHQAEARKFLTDIEAKIPQAPDLSEMIRKIEAIPPPVVIDFERELPKLGEPIRDALELLRDEERLKIEAVKNLREELDELKKARGKVETVFVGGGSASGGRIVKSYDISSSLNGVLKTFSLPAFYRIISVHSSSFPNAFRETTDWTSDAALMQITFTSEIDASTTLKAGQTITIVYSEA